MRLMASLACLLSISAVAGCESKPAQKAAYFLADVSYIQAEVLLDAGQVAIKNNDADDWHDITLTINDRWVAKRALIVSQDTVKVDLADFTTRSGERFDPATHKAERFAIRCGPSGPSLQGGPPREDWHGNVAE